MREICVVRNVTGFYAYVPGIRRWLPQYGPTERKAMRRFIKKHANYFRGFQIEVKRYKPFPEFV